MQDYPGVAPLTVNTSGAGSSGTLVSAGAADPHGYFPTAQEVQDGDRRSEANYDAAIESLVDRTNWIAWRVPDWIAGGDYSTVLTGAVTLGAKLTLLQVLTVTAGGGQAAGIFNGVSGIPALQINSIASYAVSASVLSGDGTAYLGQGHGAGHGGLFQGGATNGHGAVGQAGSSAAAGLKGEAVGGGNSLWGSLGPVFLDTNAPLGTSPQLASGDPGTNTMWANQIPKAWGYIEFGAAGDFYFGVNYTGSIVTFGGHQYVKVQLTHPMAGPQYAVMCNYVGNETFPGMAMVMANNSGGDNVPAQTASTFYIGVFGGLIAGSWSQVTTLEVGPSSAGQFALSFVVFGAQ